jgi:hypothetical protein
MLEKCVHFVKGDLLHEPWYARVEKWFGSSKARRIEPSMKWTNTKPIVPGFYWFQSRGGRKRVVEIHKDPSTRKLYVTHTGTMLEDLANDGYRWAGPIPEPQEQ